MRPIPLWQHKTLRGSQGFKAGRRRQRQVGRMEQGQATDECIFIIKRISTTHGKKQENRT